MQQKLGVKVELIDKQQLQKLEPDWKVDDVDLAAYEPDSGYGDGAGVAGDFLSAARELGVTYLSRTQAKSLIVDGGNIRGVVTDQGTISSNIAIAATGPWTRLLIKDAGYDLPIECEYHQVAMLRNPPAMKGINYFVLSLIHYLMLKSKINYLKNKIRKCSRVQTMENFR